MGQATTLKIEGMTCGHCKISVEKALIAVPRVTGGTVIWLKKEAIITKSASRDELVKLSQMLATQYSLKRYQRRFIKLKQYLI
ncbi:heavy-metal-associated domain-containing protein [Sporomusa sp.]|uniref:heavy-metal-associated domain-containing protein n=1 Tax=Sporomusa sp. TaxID=2078658 RepID=UPI002CB0BF86|nr:cation transporter [Sporomusa sp.]HWR42445.1 cation transporter [Sporomusa sp.]